MKTKHNQVDHLEKKGAIFAAMGANGGLGIAKFVAYLITGSASMLAEAIHSFADTSNQVLLLVGVKRSKREATKTHPFGYGRAHFFYAFLVSIILFAGGGLFAIYEGIHKIQDPHPTEAPLVAFIVLGIGIVLEGFSLRTALKEVKEFKPKNQNIFQFVRQSKSVNHVVLVLEDSAALFGLILGMAGVALSVITHNGVWDGIGSISIGVLLVIIASLLFIEVKSLLIGEGADDELVEVIKNEILKVETVNHVVDLKTLYIGPAELFIAMKVTVDHDDKAKVVADAIDEIEARIRFAVPVAKLIYVEPDLYKTSEEQQEDDIQLAEELTNEYIELKQSEEQE